MSAGGISYDCLTTSRKVTLPSVESWGTNMNIVKDPNKGIYTRRKDKVGETQEILLAQENSGDRIAECINVYARGVNPMVSVSYDNYGNNGGGGSRSYFGKQAVKLPYKPEVFIPPIQRQEDLTPLSRLPRNWFYAFTNPELPNVIHEMSCPNEKSAIQTKKLDYNYDTNKQYIKELPLVVSENQPQVHDEIKHIPVHSQTSEQHRGQYHDKIEVNNSKIDRNKQIYQVLTNKKGNFKKHFVPNPEIQRNIHSNLLHQIVHTNKSDVKKENIEHDTLNKNVSKKFLGQPYHTKKTSSVESSPFLLTEKDNTSGSKKELLKGSLDSAKGVYGKEVQRYDGTVPSNGIEDELLSLDYNISSNKNNSSSLKYFPQFIENDSKSQNIKNVMHIDTQTFKGSTDRTVDINLHSNTPYQGQKEHQYIDVNTNKFSSQNEKTGSIEAYTAKNINNDKLQYNIKSNKTINQQRLYLDPSNIPTKQTICVPVQSAKTQDIYKNVTPIDLSTIQRKDGVKTSVEGFKTYIDQDKWIGERPQRNARVLTSSVDFGSNHSDQQQEFYNIQGTNKTDIEQKQINIGGFDPRPQNMSRTRDELEMSNSSSIEHRYNSLQRGVQDQFNQRYMI